MVRAHPLHSAFRRRGLALALGLGLAAVAAPAVQTAEPRSTETDAGLDAAAGGLIWTGPPSFDDGRGGGPLFVSESGSLTVLTSGREAASATESPSGPFAALIEQAAARHGIDPQLLRALVLVESGYRVDAVSPAGAAGLTQLMPATARELGVADRFDAASSLMGGADYLARQLDRFGDLRLALAAYNAGPSRVARLGRIPNIPETRDYVRRVLVCLLALNAGRSPRSSRECEREPSA